jgi:exopolysaccharide production protein ExoQ
MTQPRSRAPLIDKWLFVPLVALAFTAIVAPLISFVNGRYLGPDLLNEVAWPLMDAAAIGVALNRSRSGRVAWPPHVLWLFACLAIAIASTLWSIKPGTTFIRSSLQTTVVVALALTPVLARGRSADMVRAMFLCLAFDVILNCLFGERSTAFDGTAYLDIGYSGFMPGKNVLGQLAGVTLMMALHEALHQGFRRALGISLAVAALVLLFQTDSKTSTALAFLSPALAGLMLTLRRTTSISSVVVLSILMFLAIYFKDKIGWYVFHDTTFTGRISIWEFVGLEIDRHPLLGWGYGSFWLSGPDSPALLEGPGWVGQMPHAHNGYLDIILTTGYLGFACLVMLISTTILAIERLAKWDPARAWLLLSMTVFVIFNNHLESSWLHGSDFMWVVFVMICVEAGRCLQHHQPAGAAHGLSPSSKPAGVARHTVRRPSSLARRRSI